jgi:Protein of unknown function (DUF3306)
MSKSEPFIARWSRLKRESAVTTAPGETVDGRASETEGEADAASGAELPGLPAVDPAGLPPIETILAGGDVRPFLQPGVPAALTRAALRGAWAADSAIRDFIGIAENQWDFNDPAGIPGFGPLDATDTARGMVGRALAGLGSVSAGVAAITGPAMSSPAATPDPRRDDHLDQVWLSSASRPAPTQERAGLDGPIRRDPTTGVDGRQDSRHRHGRALPR